MGNALYTGLVCVIVSGHSQNEDEPILVDAAARPRLYLCKWGTEGQFKYLSLTAP